MVWWNLSFFDIFPPDHVHSQRPFPSRSGLKFGVPNLIVTNAGNVYI